MSKVSDVVERMMRMDRLIKDGRTGYAKKFAKNLGISRSQLFNHFEELKDMGIEISYNRNNSSYEYSGEFELEVQEPLKVIKRQKNLMNVTGGSFIGESKFTGLFVLNFDSILSYSLI